MSLSVDIGAALVALMVIAVGQKGKNNERFSSFVIRSYFNCHHVGVLLV